MRKTILIGTALLLWLLSSAGWSLDSRELIRLKEAGIQDETIRLMIQEKTAETGAFTIDEILELKQSGIAETTIQMLIREQSFLKDRQSIVYGEEIRSIEFATIRDVIRLREAGLSDEIIQAIILVHSREDSLQVRKSWEMLRSMGIIVDRRAVE
jgi:hypothetical protein